MMLAIYGPTVTGKTNLSINLAKKINGVIISADSRQIYKKLDIGSGKVSFESNVKKKVDHWVVDGVEIFGFDLKEPEEWFSAADFVEYANLLAKKIESKNKVPILVGGTGFYINSFIDPPQTLGIPKNNKLRKSLEKMSVNSLFQNLLQKNQARAEAMNESDKKNPRRLIRALEVSNYRLRKNNKSVNKALLIGLTASNKYLFNKADTWLDTRIKNGLITEVENLINNNISTKWLESLGLEYRWITRYLLKKTSKEDAVKSLKGDIHSLIRRQKTYFTQFKNIQIYNIEETGWEAELEKKVSLWYTQKNNG